MKIIEYEDKYRDDMISMVLDAKDALGQVPLYPKHRYTEFEPGYMRKKL